MNKIEALGIWLEKASIEEIQNLPEEEILNMSMPRPGHPGQTGFMFPFSTQENFAEKAYALIKRLSEVKHSKEKIPEGFVKCQVCGEYNGETKKKNLNWGDSAIKVLGEEDISVSCLCQGIICRKCGKNKIHRPISNSYYQEDNSVWHHSYLSGMRFCDECREQRKNV